MKVMYKKQTEPFMLTNGKIYEVLSVERKYYRITDDTGEDYLYPPESFDIVDNTNIPPERFPNV